MNANLLANETTVAAAIPVLVSTASLARKLDVSATPIVAAVEDGRLQPAALLDRGSAAGQSPLFDLQRLAEIRRTLCP